MKPEEQVGAWAIKAAQNPQVSRVAVSLQVFMEIDSARGRGDEWARDVKVTPTAPCLFVKGPTPDGDDWKCIEGGPHGRGWEAWDVDLRFTSPIAAELFAQAALRERPMEPREARGSLLGEDLYPVLRLRFTELVATEATQ